MAATAAVSADSMAMKSTPASVDSLLAKIYEAKGMPQMTEIDWTRLLTSLGLRIGMRIALVDMSKKYIHEWRPDGSSDNSFPSRHAVWAYGVAGTLTYSLGRSQPWIAILSQTGANAIGMQRVMAKRHWPGDVLAGAGLGIGIDIASRGITNWIFGDHHLYQGWRNNPNYLCSSVSATTGASIPLNAEFGEYTLGTALTSGINAVWAENEHVGLCADITVSSAPVKCGDRLMGVLNGVSAAVGVCGNINPHSGPVGLGASFVTGYRHYLKTMDVAAAQGGIMAAADAKISLALTTKLAFGASVGYSITPLKLGDTRKKAHALNFAVLSRVNF